MTTRSNLPVVRNPVLELSATYRIQATVPHATRLLLGGLLRELADDAAQRAEQCWRKHKAPMACYWKACAVYARHIARAIERGTG